MQKLPFKFLFIIIITVSARAYGQDQTAENKLLEADSLYKNSQYTQALKIYENLFDAGHTSPNMLLKLAQINEGRAAYGESIFYLEKYYQLTEDTRILNYITKLTSDNKIEGFNYELPFYVNHYYKEYRKIILLLFVVLLLLVLAVSQLQKQPIKKHAFGIFTLLIMIAFTNNFKGITYGIITESPSFLMTGSSAGADVASEINNPLKLRLGRQTDIWIQTSFEDKKVFVKADHIKKL